ncbi:MAG: GNAT family N-acetyltransferase [Chloracidobacterium sp.]|nr:GNAT family N-acetyltransferase [Chloracidobacterium sp.]
MIIVLLSSHHDRKAFNCGEPSLNKYLQQQARQSAAKRVSRTFVAVDDEKTSTILGYHTTLVSILEASQIPSKISKSRIPALLLARLAVDQQFQGQGIGEFLLLDVLRRAVVISEQTGLYAVVLDALTDRAKNFYLRYGFSELLDDPYHLYIPIGTIVDLGLV